MMDISKVLPFLGLVAYGAISLILYLRAKTLAGKIFGSILMGVFFAILAYNFVPKDDYDLVRHWDKADKFKNVESFDSFVRVVKGNKLELLPQMFSFVIAKIGDYNLMQSLMALGGYSMLFYILIDYKNKIQMSNVKFMALLPLAILGQHMLYYFSGLYNYFAINLFALAVYLEFIKGTKKIPFLLYVITLLIHNSMLLPFALLMLFRFMKKKLTMRSIIIFIIVSVSITIIIDLLVNVFDIAYFENIKHIYHDYVKLNDNMMKYYDGFYLFMSITKIGISLLACWLQRDNEKLRQIRDFVILLSIATIILSFSSIAITRFSSLILFASLPLIIDAMSSKNKNTKFFVLAVSALSIIYLVYTVRVMMPLIHLGGV
ncbi:EpsG family protein [Candidatus Saccharibacteria bacterium]|nr:EpsG family protein [Candidatus Saccharibacteria bacterium]